MSMSFTYYSNLFSQVSKVEWKDAIDRIDREVQLSTHKCIAMGDGLPTLVTHSTYYPNSLLVAYQEVERKFPIVDMHVYTSLAKGSCTFGSHKDTMNVLIVPAIGVVQYIMGGDELVSLTPGDALFIPKGLYHNPVILGPRVTLSFGLPS